LQTIFRPDDRSNKLILGFRPLNHQISKFFPLSIAVFPPLRQYNIQ
jgi:hypothetical protein